MLGARWHLFTDPLLSLQEFVDEYANTCPAHLSVAVSGAESVDTPTGICLRVSDGLTLTVEYVYIQHPDADDDDDGSVASPVPTSFQGGDSTDDPIDSSEGSEVEQDSAIIPNNSSPVGGALFGGTNCGASLLMTATCLHLVQPAWAGGPAVCSVPPPVCSQPETASCSHRHSAPWP